MNEYVLCYEPDVKKARVLYDSKIMQVLERTHRSGRKLIDYRVHFLGWNASWDRYVPEYTILKDNIINRQLQARLKKRADALRALITKKKKRKRTIAEIVKQALKEASQSSSSSSEEEVEVIVEPIRIPESMVEFAERDWCNIKHRNMLVNVPVEITVAYIFEEYVKFHGLRELDNINKKIQTGMLTPSSLAAYVFSRTEPKPSTRFIGFHQTQRVLVDAIHEQFIKINNKLEQAKQAIDGLRSIFDNLFPILLMYNDEQDQFEKLGDYKPVLQNVDISHLWTPQQGNSLPRENFIGDSAFDYLDALDRPYCPTDVAPVPKTPYKSSNQISANQNKPRPSCHIMIHQNQSRASTSGQPSAILIPVEPSVIMRNQPGPSSAMPNQAGPASAMYNRPGPSSAMYDRPGPSSAMYDRPGPSSAMYDRPGPSSAMYDRPGPSSAMYDRPGPSSAMYDRPGPSSAMYDRPGPSSAMYDRPGPSSAMYDRPGPSSAMYDQPGPSSAMHDRPGPSSAMYNRPGPSATFQLTPNNNQPGPSTTLSTTLVNNTLQSTGTAETKPTLNQPKTNDIVSSTKSQVSNNKSAYGVPINGQSVVNLSVCESTEILGYPPVKVTPKVSDIRVNYNNEGSNDSTDRDVELAIAHILCVLENSEEKIQNPPSKINSDVNIPQSKPKKGKVFPNQNPALSMLPIEPSKPMALETPVNEPSTSNCAPMPQYGASTETPPPQVITDTSPSQTSEVQVEDSSTETQAEDSKTIVQEKPYRRRVKNRVLYTGRKPYNPPNVSYTSNISKTSGFYGATPNLQYYINCIPDNPRLLPFFPRLLPPAALWMKLHNEFLNKLISWKFEPDPYLTPKYPSPAMLYGFPHFIRFLIKLPMIFNKTAIPKRILRHVVNHINQMIDHIEESCEFREMARYRKKPEFTNVRSQHFDWSNYKTPAYYFDNRTMATMRPSTGDEPAETHGTETQPEQGPSRINIQTMPAKPRKVCPASENAEYNYSLRSKPTIIYNSEPYYAETVSVPCNRSSCSHDLESGPSRAKEPKVAEPKVTEPNFSVIRHPKGKLTPSVKTGPSPQGLKPVTSTRNQDRQIVNKTILKKTIVRKARTFYNHKFGAKPTTESLSNPSQPTVKIEPLCPEGDKIQKGKNATPTDQEVKVQTEYIKPKVRPVSKTKAQPVSKTKTQPVFKTKAQPVCKTKVQPVFKTKAQPVSKVQPVPKVQPVFKTKAQPVPNVQPVHKELQSTSTAKIPQQLLDPSIVVKVEALSPLPNIPERRAIRKSAADSAFRTTHMLAPNSMTSRLLSSTRDVITPKTQADMSVKRSRSESESPKVNKRTKADNESEDVKVNVLEIVIKREPIDESDMSDDGGESHSNAGTSQSQTGESKVLPHRKSRVVTVPASAPPNTPSRRQFKSNSISKESGSSNKAPAKTPTPPSTTLRLRSRSDEHQLRSKGELINPMSLPMQGPSRTSHTPKPKEGRSPTRRNSSSSRESPTRLANPHSSGRQSDSAPYLFRKK